MLFVHNKRGISMYSNLSIFLQLDFKSIVLDTIILPLTDSAGISLSDSELTSLFPSRTRKMYLKESEYLRILSKSNIFYI